jgi:hypothetical protein
MKRHDRFHARLNGPLTERLKEESQEGKAQSDRLDEYGSMQWQFSGSRIRITDAIRWKYEYCQFSRDRLLIT